MGINNLSVIGFQSQYSNQFYQLNKVWIEESWVLEDSDKNDLLNPEKIVINGGEVFFALSSNEVIGTVAMIKSSDKIYELAKMTVKKNFRGKGVANLLMDRCIEFAIEQKAVQIFLISNDSLVIARNLYDKYGFKEVVLDLTEVPKRKCKNVAQINT